MAMVRGKFSERVSVAVEFDPSEDRTRQEMKEECDINHIMSRYIKTGTIAHVNKFEGQYGDVQAIDFHAAMNTIRHAEEMFDALPAKVRVKFMNDPAAFLEFCAKPENVKDMRDLGLMKPEVQAAVTAAVEAAGAAKVKAEGDPEVDGDEVLAEAPAPRKAKPKARA